MGSAMGSGSGQNSAAKRYLVHYGLQNASGKSIILSIYSQKLTDKFDKFISNKTPKNFSYQREGGRRNGSLP